MFSTFDVDLFPKEEDFFSSFENEDMNPFIETNPNEIPVNVLRENYKKYPPFFRTRMQETIKAVNEYSWKRGELGGLDWGFSILNKALEGLNTGVHIVAGQSNVGKSAYMVQLAWQVASCNQYVDEKHPKKAFVLFFSLDDSNNELVPRFIAIDQRIPINVIRFPKKYQDRPDYMEKREIGLQHLYDSVDFLNVMDVNQGSSIEFILKTIQEYYVELQNVDPTYQLVVFIDNFHDISIEDPHLRNRSENERFDYIADTLTKTSTMFDAPIVATAEFRKLNGNRRPTNDDVKQSGKIVYEAKSISLVYNDCSLRGQQANVFWMLNDNPNKQPIYEVHISKNKFSSFKGRAFFEFIPEMSFFREVPEAGAKRYAAMIAG